MYGMEWLVNRMRIKHLESSPRVKSLDSDAIPDRRAIRLVSSRLVIYLLGRNIFTKICNSLCHYAEE